jgi:chromate transporter
VGYGQAGVLGSLAASLGVAFPSFVFVMVIMRFLARFKESRHADNIFKGLRPAVVGLITAAAVRMAWKEFFPGTSGIDFNITSVEVKAICISAIVFVAVHKFKMNIILMIGLSALAGVLLFR